MHVCVFIHTHKHTYTQLNMYILTTPELLLLIIKFKLWEGHSKNKVQDMVLGEF